MAETATISASMVMRVRAARLWHDVLHTMAGHERDYTRGTLVHAIVLLAVPMVLEMAMESIFGVVDIFFVGRLGAEAVAVVGITEAVLTLVFATAVGLSSAATALVARRVGEKKTDAASHAAVQAILLGVVASIATAVLGAWFADDLLRLMGAGEETIALGTDYTRIIFIGSFTIYLLFLINAIFRGAGDPALSLRALWIANLINMVLDPLLIFGWGPFPELGLTGAAVATTLGRGIGVIYQLNLLIEHKGHLDVRLRHLRPDPQVVRKMVSVAWPGMLQFLISTASWLGVVRLLTPFGDAALAGYTIALRLVVFAILPSWGLCGAAGTLVGQCMGAQKIDRAERAAWTTGFINMVGMSVVALVFVPFAPLLIGLFSTDSAAVAQGTQALRWLAYSFPLFAYGMVVSQSLNGAGDTVSTTWINLISYWLIQLPAAWLFSGPMGFGASGIFAALGLAEASRGVVGMLWFRRGAWKRRAL